jgi:micrococcal nuclease
VLPMTVARKTAVRLTAALVGILLVSACSDPTVNTPVPNASSDAPTELFPVLSVADGDTMTVDIAGARERIRLIGIDAPEVSGAPECFGNEAALYAKNSLSGTSVGLVPDPTQDDRDRYGRLLRYVILPDGTDFDAQLIALGYAHEYTYDKPYQRQSAYRAAQSAATSAKRGLWSPETCNGATPSAISSAAPSTPAEPGPAAAGCDIKGNINSKGEKIYHQPGDSSYPETVITESKGERYFCSVAEAVAAGWRPAKN